MFFNGSIFWFLMGLIFVLVAAGFAAFARDRGWQLTWWKGLLAVIWYAIPMLTLFAYGTLLGENESSAALRVLGVGLFASLVLGVGLWRLLALKPAAAAE